MNSQVEHHTTWVCIPDEGGICMRAGDDGFGYPATGYPPFRQMPEETNGGQASIQPYYISNTNSLTLNNMQNFDYL